MVCRGMYGDAQGHVLGCIWSRVEGAKVRTSARRGLGRECSS